jgi:hypothetical protein
MLLRVQFLESGLQTEAFEMIPVFATEVIVGLYDAHPQPILLDLRFARLALGPCSGRV